MKRFFTVAAVLVGFILTTTMADAQSFSSRKKYLSVGVSLTAANYFGDLAPQTSQASLDLSQTRPGLGITGTYKMHPRISVRGQLQYFRLQADDFKQEIATAAAEANEGGGSTAEFTRSEYTRYLRNLHFRNDIVELNVVGIFELFENRGTFLRRPDFNVYGIIGIAGFYHNPKALDGPNGEWQSLQPLQTEGVAYSKIQFAIPAGLGVKYRISDRMDIGLELSYRFIFTDYIDDVSSTYPSPVKVNAENRTFVDRSGNSTAALANELRYEDAVLRAVTKVTNGVEQVGFGTKPGNERGDPTDNDQIILLSAHLNYVIGGGVRTPKFR